MVLGKQVRRVRTSEAVVSMGSCTVAARVAKDRTRGGVIRNPENVLGDTRGKIGGIDHSVDTGNTTITRSIQGSNVPDISSRRTDRSDKVWRSSGSTYVRMIAGCIAILNLQNHLKCSTE